MKRSRSLLRVLSVRQPFASLIASGEKTVELRKRSTPYRGPVLIVSGGRPWPGLGARGPLGVTLCVVDLVDCRPAVSTDAGDACATPPAGWFAWEFRNPRPVRQVPIKSRLGLYVAGPELESIATEPSAA